jgi:hypothetical protein
METPVYNATSVESGDMAMAQRVNLDAMIPREDFGLTTNDDATSSLINDFPLSNLDANSPIRMQLRKPDFQRETNHWTPEQFVTFVASFLDREVIPSLILWKSPSFIFVIDGGHRLSALRAWMEDDYGDGAISQVYYNGEITEVQKRVARRTRALVESQIGRYSSLRALVGQKLAVETLASTRAGSMFTRTLQLQWVIGSPQVAETSFFKINSQGTPLDTVEEMLIRNRMKPLAIGARAIMRAGRGHKYWSKFTPERQAEIQKAAEDLFKLLFKPEVTAPLKTLDVPLGGATSPVDALSIIIEYLTYAASPDHKKIKLVSEYVDDDSGETTVHVLKRSLTVANRITGNTAGSLGLHPAVYFYSETGKHSRFLFLGVTLLIAQRLHENNTDWFKSFCKGRSHVEEFLIKEKSLIGMILRTITPNQRALRMRDLIAYLVSEGVKGVTPTPEAAIAHLGVKGRIFDGTAIQSGKLFSDETKSMAYIRKAIASAQKCTVCAGLLDTHKSVSYDHITPVSAGGTGDVENLDMLHPYCNTGLKGSIPKVG